jgi:hypothetical protein
MGAASRQIALTDSAASSRLARSTADTASINLSVAHHLATNICSTLESAESLLSLFKG